MTYSFTGKTASSTYGRLVQVIHGTPDTYYDGFGNLLDLGAGTASIGPQGPQGSQGPTGPSGDSVSFVGTWDNSTIYFPLEIVTYNGVAYISNNASSTQPGPPYGTPSVTPSVWTPISYGITGSQGPQGVTGSGFTTIYNASPTRILTASGSNAANAQSNLTFDGSVLSLHNQQIQNVSSIDFSTNLSNPSPTASRLFYDYTEEALAYYSDNLQNPIHIGRELSLRVYNITGTTISVGQAVHVNGATAGLPTVVLSLSNPDLNATVNGVANENIPNGQIGQIITNGIITGVDTTSLILTSVNSGDALYLSDIIPGKYSTDYFGLSYSSRANVVGYVIATGSNGSIYVTTNNENLNLSITDRQRNILEGNVISGGVFYFQTPGFTISTPTSVNISPMKGWIVDNAGPTSSTRPTVKLIEYSGATGVTISNITSTTETYFLVDSNGLLTQQNSFPSPRQRREKIYLGKVGHANKSTIANVFPEPDIDISPSTQLRDMFTPIKLINSGVYPSYIGATLSFQTSAGSLWGLGIGYITDVLNPSSINVPGYSPVTFQYRTRLGGTYSNTTVIDPGSYDNNGVRTTIGAPTKQATNQRIFLIQNGIFRVQYGQTVYSDLTTALASVQNEVFDTFSNFRDNGILIGVLSVVSNATNLSDPLQAKFLLVSKFGEVVGAAGGLSTTTLQQAYNNSGEPEIVTNSTLDGVTFRRGSSSDTDNVFVVQNGSASNTFYVQGNGNTYMSSLHVTNMGLTSGATKYMVIDDSGNTWYQTTIIGGGGATGPVGPTGAGGALGYYGAFYDTTDQLNPTASVARPMLINSTYESNGVVLYSNSGIIFQYPGTYNIQFSTVFAQSNASVGLIDVWFVLNGTSITASNTQFSISGNSDQVVSWNFIKTVNANDYIQIYWSSSDTSISINYSGTQSNPSRPSVPSVIITAHQIMYTQLGPTGSQGPTGPAGSNGTQGPTGPQGSNGSNGNQGPTGPQGSNGSNGNQGPTGPQGSAGSNGTQGPTGPQGSAGSNGPQGFQGDQGPQGPAGSGSGTSSTFLYRNVLYLHPNGSNSTAIVGNKDYPYRTFGAAIAAALLLTNPVIEVWPGTVSGTQSYNYSENSIPTIDSDITIYLKPNVKILLTNSVTRYFEVDNQARLKIVSDDSTSSISCDGAVNFFNIINGSVHLENLSLYFSLSNPAITQAFFIKSLVKGAQNYLTAKNCYFDFDENGRTDISGRFNCFEAKNISFLDFSNCKFYLNITTIGGGDMCFFNTTADDAFDLCRLFLRNSQSIVSTNNNERINTLSIIESEDPNSYSNIEHTIDDCTFYQDGNRIGAVLQTTTQMSLVNLVSRSIHNYDVVDNGGVSYTTGKPESIVDLGVAGYGFLEKYAINIPFTKIVY